MAKVQGHAMSGTGNDDTSIDKKMSCTIVVTSSPMHDKDARNRSRRVSRRIPYAYAALELIPRRSCLCPG